LHTIRTNVSFVATPEEGVLTAKPEDLSDLIKEIATWSLITTKKPLHAEVCELKFSNLLSQLGVSHFGVASWRAQSVVSGSKVKGWRGLRGHPHNDLNAACKHNSQMHRTVFSGRRPSIEARNGQL
jgi:hypothetical protein